MDHVAIDLGAKKSQICVRAADGRILEEKRWPTGELETYLAGRPASRVIVETCAEAFCVADAARKLGHETRVVPATLVKTLGVGARPFTRQDRRHRSPSNDTAVQRRTGEGAKRPTRSTAAAAGWTAPQGLTGYSAATLLPTDR